MKLHHLSIIRTGKIAVTPLKSSGMQAKTAPTTYKARSPRLTESNII